MRKRLRHVAVRLRAGSNGRFHTWTSVRSGLQEPQQMHGIPVPVRVHR